MVSTPRKQCPFLRGLDLNSLGSSYKLPDCENTNLFLCSSCSQGSRWCYLTILSSAAPFSSCLQFFPASGSFPMSRHFTSDGQSIGASASASILPMNIQDWFLLELTSLISLLCKGLSAVFSSTTNQKRGIKGDTDHQSRLDAWNRCSGLVHWEDPEGWDGEGGGRGDRDGEHM